MQFRSEESRYNIVLGEQKTKLLSEGFFKQYAKVETNATRGFSCKGCYNDKKNLQASVFPFVNEGGFWGIKTEGIFAPRYFATYPKQRRIFTTVRSKNWKIR